MVAITLRADLTRGLTNEEIDANMTNLKAAAEAAALTASWASVTGKPATLAGYGITDAQAALVSGTNIKTVNGQSVLGSGNIQIDGGVTSFNTRTGAVTLISGDVTDALGFTPYNSTNPNGFITSSASITGSAATNSVALAGVLDPQKLPNQHAVSSVSYDNSNQFPGLGDFYSSITIRGRDNFAWQIIGPSYDSAYGSDENEIYVRAGNGTTWSPMRGLIHSGNIGFFSPSKTGVGAQGNWNINVSGSAAAVAWSGVSGTPTTLAGYGITDAQALDADLTAIAALAGTSGFLKKTAANTWALDTTTYLTGINSSQVTTALGFTPYNSTNPNGYITSSALSSYLPLSGGQLSGDLQLSDKFLRFDQSGTRSWNVRATGGNLDVASGDGSGSLRYNGNAVLHAGNYSSYAAPASHTHTSIVSPNGGTVVAADAAFPSAGQTFQHSLAQGPDGNDGHILAMSWSNTASVYGAQIWLDTDPTNRMAIRSRSSAGVWNSWSEVLTSGNVGSNAAPVSHNHSYLPLSGGTLTGSRPIQLETSGGSVIITGDSGGWGMGLYFKGSDNVIKGSFGALGGGAGFSYLWAGVDYSNNWMTWNSSDINAKKPITLGGRTNSSTFGGNSGGMSGNAFVAEIRANGAKPTLTFHYENVATTHIEHLSDGSLNVWRPASEGTSVLKVGNNVALHAGNYTSYTDSRYVSNLARVRTFLIDGLGASGTQARRYEIARIAIDYNDWNSTGSFEVELFETYFAASMKKRYQVTYGYGGQNYATLVEMIGGGTNSFQVTVGSPIQVSGDHYYLPVYVDVRYYAACAARITTSRYISTANTPGIGEASVFVTPGGVDISDFSPDSTVNISHSASAWQVGGNTLLHAANYSSYALPLSGGTITGSTWSNTTGGDFIISNSGIVGASATLRPTNSASFSAGWSVYAGASGAAIGDGSIGFWNHTAQTARFYVTQAGAGYFAGNLALTSASYSSYALPLTGGTLTGNLSFAGTGGGVRTIGIGDNGNTTLVLQAGGISGTGANLELTRDYYAYLDANETRLRSVDGGTIYLTVNSSGITATGNVTAYSDESLKKDWAPVAKDFIERLATVKNGTYTRIDSSQRQAGSSAQDWQKLLPEVVSESTDEAKILSLAYGNAALVSAVELAKRVVEQEKRIARLEALVEKLIGD